MDDTPHKQQKCNTAALIVAAGRGDRLGASRPKQYLMLAGEAILRRTARAFLNHDGIDKVQIVIHQDDRAAYDHATQSLGERLLPPVIGGKTRQASVLLGLEALETHQPEHILIHDGARPFVTDRLISNVVESLEIHDGAIPALPVTDTIKQTAGHSIDRTLDRSSLAAAQTPQGFHFPKILNAHRNAVNLDVTDDSAIGEHAGLRIAAVKGDPDNIKITTQQDLTRARAYLNAEKNIMETHIGQGFDVHRFCAGEQVILCGVPIPHTHGLEGHSDADVGLHALTDALLGAIGEGDIGRHFPPSDDTWKDAASEVFLKKARDLIAARDGSLVNADITLICEMPKISPHVAAMRQSIADILGVSGQRIAIKATTSEGLGFTGRKEGIAAMAVASVALPARPE